MKYVHSVGLVLIDRYGRILIIKEKQDKPKFKKVAGMLSVPIETMKDGEGRVTALKRLVFEEVSPTLGDLAARFVNELVFEISDEYTEKLYLYKAQCYEPFVARPVDNNEIEYYGWLSPVDFLNLNEPKRIEVVDILMHTFASDVMRE